MHSAGTGTIDTDAFIPNTFGAAVAPCTALVVPVVQMGFSSYLRMVLVTPLPHQPYVIATCIRVMAMMKTFNDVDEGEDWKRSHYSNDVDFLETLPAPSMAT